MTTFNSLACGRISGNGALNFFGETVIQSHEPDRGELPEVSIWVFRPAACKALVKKVSSCINGSPPVITTISATFFFTSATRFSIFHKGCLPASQLSFTSHHTQPTSHPPKRMK